MPERTCTIENCGEKHSAKGLCKRHYRKQWYADHKDRERQTMAQWRAANRQYDRQRWADFYAKNAVRLNAQRRAEYADDPEAGRARQAEYRQLNPDGKWAWQQANPEAAALINRANVANHRRGADQNIGVDDLRAVLNRDGMTCFLCGRPIASLDDLHFAYVIRLSAGGPNTVDNIRPAHARCNLRRPRSTM